MTQPGTIRRMFPGGNTAQGFYSFYDNVIDTDARRVFFLKGGPGTGKSTFMKRIAEELVNKGFDAELHHCSADARSVDAVVFPSIGVAMFDGTAPHVLDPKFPGLVDEIVDLGQFGDESALQPHKDDILRLSAMGKRSFQRAYNFLAAAKHVRDNEAAVHRRAMADGFVHRQALALVDDVLSIVATLGASRTESTAASGRRRRLFASSITPNGPRHHLDSLVDSLSHVFVARGRPGAGASYILNKVADAVTDRGLDAELFFCALDPNRLEHVIIPDIGAAVITSRSPHEHEPYGATVIDLHEGLSLTDEDSNEATIARRLFDDLFDQAVVALLDAQTCHLKVEALYAPAMDFERMEELRLRVRDRILTYAGR